MVGRRRYIRTTSLDERLAVEIERLRRKLCEFLPVRSVMLCWIKHVKPRRLSK